jgi:hypothetical protein
MGAPNGEQPKGLESKWWYRLLRVTLLPLYGLVLLVTFLLIYGGNRPYHVLDSQKSFIVCDDGKTFRLSELGYVYLSEPGEQLSRDDADRARNLCSYGETSAPSEGLETVEMPDGAHIEGVPLEGYWDAIAHKYGGWEIDPKTGERMTKVKKADLGALYQRWLASPAGQASQLEDRKIEAEARGKFTGVRSILQFPALHTYTLKAAFNTEGSWARMFSYMAIAWLAIHLAVVMVRGAVLYVAVGRFLPVSGVRGWLTL